MPSSRGVPCALELGPPARVGLGPPARVGCLRLGVWGVAPAGGVVVVVCGSFAHLSCDSTDLECTAHVPGDRGDFPGAELDATIACGEGIQLAQPVCDDLTDILVRVGQEVDAADVEPRLHLGKEPLGQVHRVRDA